MPIEARFCVVAIASILGVPNPSSSPGAYQTAVDWLRGSGKDLQIRLRGEVFESDGQAAAEIQVSGKLNAIASKPQLEPTIDGHRFEIWILVNQPR